MIKIGIKPSTQESGIAIMTSCKLMHLFTVNHVNLYALIENDFREIIGPIEHPICIKYYLYENHPIKRIYSCNQSESDRLKTAYSDGTDKGAHSYITEKIRSHRRMVESNALDDTQAIGCEQDGERFARVMKWSGKSEYNSRCAALLFYSWVSP